MSLRNISDFEGSIRSFQNTRSSGERIDYLFHAHIYLVDLFALKIIAYCRDTTARDINREWHEYGWLLDEFEDMTACLLFFIGHFMYEAPLHQTSIQREHAMVQSIQQLYTSFRETADLIHIWAPEDSVFLDGAVDQVAFEMYVLPVSRHIFHLVKG